MAKPDEKTIHVPVMECLHKRGYELFAERVEALIKERGKIRILFDMAGFHGWEKGAQWFGIDKVFSDVECVAFVGDRKWEKNIGALCKPFPCAQLRCFDQAHIDHAEAWVNSNDPVDGP
jgi:hypothetical protein